LIDTKKYVCFMTNDFLQNAGIVGIINLLDFLKAKKDKDYIIKETKLYIRKEYLSNIDLAQAYIDAFIDKYYNETHYAKVMKSIEILEDLTRSDDFLNIKEQKTKVDKEFAFIKKMLSLPSYISGYAILKEAGKSWDIPGLLETIKNEPDYVQKMNRVAELKTILKQKEVKETLALKSIIYLRINMFWGDKSFLLRANSKKNIKEAFEKDFTDLFNEYVQQGNNNKKIVDHCIACGNAMSASVRNSTASIAMMKDLADDLSRKTSVFWNFQMDAYICPCCALLYTLVPLGFVPMGPDMVFVNTNSSIQFLMQTNQNNSLTGIETENEKWKVLYNKIIQAQLMKTEARVSNIQVIVRKKEKERYDLNIIDKNILEIIDGSKSSLENLTKGAEVKENGEYINIYNEVVENIMHHRSQYLLIQRLFKISVDQTNVVACIYNIIAVQTVQIKSKIRNGDKTVSKQKLLFACKGGDQLRKKIAADATVDETDNKLRGIVFKYLNALQVGDQFGFMNVTLRLCTSYNMEVPSVFMEAFNSEEEFLNIAYSFLLGLKGGFYEKKDGEPAPESNKENQKSKERKED